MIVSREPDNLWNVFVSGNVVLAQDFSDASAGLSHASETTGAVQLGADYRVTPHFLVGAMFGYGHTDATLDTLGSTASVDTYSPGVYASYSDGGWYANALGSYGFPTTRRIATSPSARSTARPTAFTRRRPDRGRSRRRLRFPLRGLGPSGPPLGVAIRAPRRQRLHGNRLPGADLCVNQNESDSLRSRLGGRMSYAIQDGGHDLHAASQRQLAARVPRPEPRHHQPVRRHRRRLVRREDPRPEPRFRAGRSRPRRADRQRP